MNTCAAPDVIEYTAGKYSSSYQRIIGAQNITKMLALLVLLSLIYLRKNRDVEAALDVMWAAIVHGKKIMIGEKAEYYP